MFWFANSAREGSHPSTQKATSSSRKQWFGTNRLMNSHCHRDTKEVNLSEVNSSEQFLLLFLCSEK